jgi:dihydrofolate reductase
MPELVYYVATSLDGRIAAPDGDFSAFPTAGDHMEWILREYRDALPAPALAALGLTPDGRRFGAVVMGWNTYAVGLPVGLDRPYPHLDQVVVTRTHRPDVPPDGVRFTDDPVAEVRRLKATPGADVWLCGGGVLAAHLAAEIDRLVLKVNPVVLGAGRPLFVGPYDPRPFTLATSTPFASGVVVQEYARTIRT